MENTAETAGDMQPDGRDRQKVITKIPRSVASYARASRRTLADKAVAWLLPWSFYSYPGIHRGLFELTGIAVNTLRTYRTGHRQMTSRVALILADVIRTRCAAGLELVNELEASAAAYEASRRVKVPTGWQVVRERNGVVRDGRGSFKRRDKPVDL